MRIYTLGLNHSKRLFQHILSHISIHFPIVRPRPTLLVIGLTNACNLKCSFCFQSEQGAHHLENRGERFMTKETFLKILDEAKGLCDFIEFGLFGEPLMHPNIIEFASIAKKRGFHLTIDSNSTLYTSAMAEAFVKASVNSVVFSIDGTNEEEYEAVRKGALFKDVKKSLELLKLSKEKQKSKLPLLIARGLEIEQKTSKKHKKWMSKLGFQHILFSPLQNWSGLFSKAEEKKSKCTFPWLIMSIDSDGEILPCCEDYNAKLSMGNVQKDNLTSIWNSKNWVKLRKVHSSKLENDNLHDPCKSCSYLKNKTLPLSIRIQLYTRAFKEFYLDIFN